ncbi:High affinity nitrate transporter 2.5 [Bienertia sinuspersici]
MQAFHLSWFQFFSCFLATFAAAPLLPVIRDNLNLTATDIGNAGIGSVSGAVFARLLLGTACDLTGPRLASSAISLLTAPAVYLSAVANSPATFFLTRFVAGFSLATFVSTQYWMSSMFSATVVAQANGQSAGWGNLGGGNFNQLQKSGQMHKDKALKVIYHGVTNYRSWITALGYGFSFGVELAVLNVIAYYFFDRFNLNIYLAGVVGSTFGMVNLFSRSAGGWFSDSMAKKFGMPGRLWGWWIVQTLSGAMCIVLGSLTTFGASVAVMIILGFLVQAAEGLTFGVVPFVSRRSMGVVSGMAGAGGNVGAVIVQAIFFRGSQFTTEKGLTYMGIMVMICTLGITTIYFPQWGGMFCGPKPNFTEEDYYLQEWDSDEQQQGLHHVSMKFAEGSRNERSSKGKSLPMQDSLPA